MTTAYDREILQLDPVKDHCRITFLMATCVYPFDIPRALELALFRTYAVPRISGLLRHTGELTECTRKRYDDTDLLLSELIEHGYDSPRGQAAIENINRQHARYTIRNDDYLYVLSTFIFEPIRWIARFGHRPLSEKERLAWFHFWRAIGMRMNIQDIHDEYAQLEQFNRSYEAERFHYSNSNRYVADKTIDLLLGFYMPPVLFRLGRPAVYALLDRPLLNALGLSGQSIWLSRVLTLALHLRGRIASALPIRNKPVMRTQLHRPSYPDGYRIDDLGPEKPPQQRD